MNRLMLTLAAAAVISLPNNAAAQGFLNPFVGTTVTSPAPDAATSQAGFGVALGNLGKIVGAETEFAYYPEILETSAGSGAKSKAITFSGNTLIGPHIGAVKVYGAIGFGNLYLNVTTASSLVVPTAASISNNYMTLNLGGGVAGFFSKRFGVRADLRQYRAFGFKLTDVESVGLDLDRFDFWRANVGVAIKF